MGGQEVSHALDEGRIARLSTNMLAIEYYLWPVRHRLAGQAAREQTRRKPSTYGSTHRLLKAPRPVKVPAGSSASWFSLRLLRVHRRNGDQIRWRRTRSRYRRQVVRLRRERLSTISAAAQRRVLRLEQLSSRSGYTVSPSLKQPRANGLHRFLFAVVKHSNTVLLTIGGTRNRGEIAYPEQQRLRSAMRFPNHLEEYCSTAPHSINICHAHCTQQSTVAFHKCVSNPTSHG